MRFVREASHQAQDHTRMLTLHGHVAGKVGLAEAEKNDGRTKMSGAGRLHSAAAWSSAELLTLGAACGLN